MSSSDDDDDEVVMNAVTAEQDDGFEIEQSFSEIVMMDDTVLDVTPANSATDISTYSTFETPQQQQQRDSLLQDTDSIVAAANEEGFQLPTMQHQTATNYPQQVTAAASSDDNDSGGNSSDDDDDFSDIGEDIYQRATQQIAKSAASETIIPNVPTIHRSNQQRRQQQSEWDRAAAEESTNSWRMSRSNDEDVDMPINSSYSSNDSSEFFPSRGGSTVGRQYQQRHQSEYNKGQASGNDHHNSMDNKDNDRLTSNQMMIQSYATPSESNNNNVTPSRQQHTSSSHRRSQQQQESPSLIHANQSATPNSNRSTAARRDNHHPSSYHHHHHPSNTATTTNEQDVSAGVLPDYLMVMRQKIESMTMFDSDILNMTAKYGYGDSNDPMVQESRESLKRSSQQSISAAVLVSLAHKRYERRRLAAMEIEKVVRSLVTLQQQKKNDNELDRVRNILILLSDDYVRSTSEDARKGGVVALAACAIGLKKANDYDPVVAECRDLILASVVHSCQDHSQRVRYYATESLFNVVKVIPSLAVQHFFILFEILRSLFADVDSDVRGGADLLDRKLKEVIAGAMNTGRFRTEDCVPVFARFVYMRNKATKRLTLTWLQELNEKLDGAPILEFLHLFLGGIFDMVADPTNIIRQSALAFLQSVLPKLAPLSPIDGDDEDVVKKVNFDKILQSLVTTMEHPSPLVRKVAMHWMSRIVKAHMVGNDSTDNVASAVTEESTANDTDGANPNLTSTRPVRTAASLSVRNALPHVLPGILLSIGDSFTSVGNGGGNNVKDLFLPDQTTRSLAEQTNKFLQNAVRREGYAYIEHLDGFIVALREELNTPGGLSSKNPPALDRKQYRLDVQQDGTGIETTGWFRSSQDAGEVIDMDAMVMSRLAALHWVIVLYETVVPDVLKADYAREFVSAIIHQLADRPSQTIVFKSLEVLARITVPVSGEEHPGGNPSGVDSDSPLWASFNNNNDDDDEQLHRQVYPMTEDNIDLAMRILCNDRQRLKSRDREVFAELILIHSQHEHLLDDLSNIITYMCTLQPPEFVMISFAVELDAFLSTRKKAHGQSASSLSLLRNSHVAILEARDLRFASAFVQHMTHVLLNTDGTKKLRIALKDCVANDQDDSGDSGQAVTISRSRKALFHILLHSVAQNIPSTLALCLWSGAYRTASIVLNHIDPLDISLMFLLEVDRLIEMLERPIFRHLHVRMLERDSQPSSEGSGAMLFQFLTSLLMILPQSTCYRILRDRLSSVARFRQSIANIADSSASLSSSYENDRCRQLAANTKEYVDRVQSVRRLHCSAVWYAIRQESLEVPKRDTSADASNQEENSDRRAWLGYASKEEEEAAHRARLENNTNKADQPSNSGGAYMDLATVSTNTPRLKHLIPNAGNHDITALEETALSHGKGDEKWKEFWTE